MTSQTLQQRYRPLDGLRFDNRTTQTEHARRVSEALDGVWRQKKKGRFLSRISPDRLEELRDAICGVPQYKGVCRYRERNEDGRFIVVDADGREHLLRGETPSAIRKRLDDLFGDFKKVTPHRPYFRRRTADERETFAWAAASLYVGLLSIRPFAAANDDVAYVMLHAALHRLGLRALELAPRTAPLNHAIADALCPPHLDMAPLANLLKENVLELSNG